MWLFWFFNALMHHSSPCIRIITLVLQRAALPFITLLVFGWPGMWKWLGKYSMFQHFWSQHREITQETWRALKAPVSLCWWHSCHAQASLPQAGQSPPAPREWDLGSALHWVPGGSSWNFRERMCSIGISYCSGKGLRLCVCRAWFYSKTHLLFINRSHFLGESQQ